ncbi:sensor histidine kinase [Ammoniphilus sp. CFH 90114]|uniref:sensor histidine kinase n=1 Tax=Ammoniphilus sp. CFH 90114 TaxID=2493665 RepID=UPI00100DE1D9|nr:ATP-binding protein [Ammoniphilus sp. CFH 90114]RXT07236.1 histidine kinase [Ammoniphilus sp. CFH 90114]
MSEKQELIDLLTGIKSSRKSYYHELNQAILELQLKNKQLEVINQLTRLQVNLSWEEASYYIAVQVGQVLSFTCFALTLMEGKTTSSYIVSTDTSPSSVQTLRFSELENKPTLSTVNRFIEEHQGSTGTTVTMRNHVGQVFGFLTLLHRETNANTHEDLLFFHRIAEQVAVSVENILLFKDVSDKVKIEAQLLQSAKLAAIGEMAAGIAHELNSPLTAILGNVQLLLREFKEDRPGKMLQDIYQCGVRSKKIIQNLLVFSRQEEFTFEDLSLHDLIEDVFSLIGYQLKVSGIPVEKRWGESLPLFRGNRYQIEQVMINLLLNAKDALQQEKEPVITIETKVVKKDSKPYVSFSVRDNGTGIDEKILPQIFNPFFTTKEHMKGTGLGLSVSLGIVQAHHGMLVAESRKGEYTKFTLMLPGKGGVDDHE